MKIILEDSDDYMSLVVLERFLKECNWERKDTDVWYNRVFHTWTHVLGRLLNQLYRESYRSSIPLGKPYTLPIGETYSQLLREDDNALKAPGSLSG